MTKYKHQPVMISEALEYLQPKAEGIYIDGTLGGGGHVSALVRKFKAQNHNATIIGVDRDLEAIFAAKKNLAGFKDQIIFIHDNFSNLPAILKSQNINKVDGILLDLGVSSYQFDNPKRGFSFQTDASLDMRMNQNDDFTAGDIVNRYNEKQLADLFYNYGEERYSRQIARKIVEARRKKPIETTAELVEIIKSATPPKYRFGSKIHFATRVFQALRIEVNDELSILKEFIPKAIEFLSKDGRLVIISFHSLEDRIVKQAFRDLENNLPNHYKVLTKKPIIPSEEEISQNPRSRSAKMRVLEKI